MEELIKRIRALAIELSARGTQPGHVGAGTQGRASELNRELVSLYNAEGDRHTTTEFFKKDEDENLISDEERSPVTWFTPNARGEVLLALIQHLVNGTFGKPTQSKAERELAILATAKELPLLCDLLELKPESQPSAASQLEIRVGDLSVFRETAGNHGGIPCRRSISFD